MSNMPIQIQDIDHENEQSECPLCMEPLEVDDINFFPCACGYQICRFCWHRIRTDENGLCPACRTSYPEDPAEFKPLTGSDLQKIRYEKRQKEAQRRQKLTDGRRHLASIRVLQKNLVFVVGLSHRLSDPEILKRQEYFGKYGRILKVVINSNTAYAGTQGPSSSAYVTYSKMEEALQAIQSVNNVYIDGRTLKASLGTTKYCSTYLKNQQCHKADCMYLHELADDDASFTKEDMQLGKHQEFEQKLIDRMIQQDSEPTNQQTTENDNNTTTTTITTTSTTESTNRKNIVVTSQNSWSNVAKEKMVQENSNEKPREGESPHPVLTSKKPLPTQTLRETAGLLQKNVIRTDAKTALVTTPAPDTSVTTPVVTSTTSNPDNKRIDSDDNATIKPINPPSNINEETNDVPLCNDEFVISKLSETENFENKLSSETQNLSLSNEVQPSSISFPTLNRYNEEDTNFNTDLYKSDHFTSMSELTWNNTPNNPLPDVIPIKSSNDWEAAFGFNSDPSKVTPNPSSTLTSIPSGEDDDLGFDPWFEVNKGLTELLEKESNAQHNLGGRLLNTDYPPSHLPPQQNYPIHPPNNNTVTSPTRHGLSEWQNGLRALLPSVNINFAMEQPNQNQPQGFNSFRNGLGVREKPRFQMGYDQWGFNPTNTNQPNNHSSLFPTSNNSQNSYFHNNFGRNNNAADRFGSLAPPPGLLSQQFPNDPAIIAGGSKPPMPTSFRAPQHPLEDTPHWMKSLQTLTDTDSYNKPAQTGFLPPKKDIQIPATTFSGWPNLGSRDQVNRQPPPGFQNRLPYTNSTEFGLMLEHHS